MTSRLICVNDIYAFDPNAKVNLDQFEDIIGRNFRQPKEGLGWTTVRPPTCGAPSCGRRGSFNLRCADVRVGLTASNAPHSRHTLGHDQMGGVDPDCAGGAGAAFALYALAGDESVSGIRRDVATIARPPLLDHFRPGFKAERWSCRSDERRQLASGRSVQLARPVHRTKGDQARGRTRSGGESGPKAPAVPSTQGEPGRPGRGLKPARSASRCRGKPSKSSNRMKTLISALHRLGH